MNHRFLYLNVISVIVLLFLGSACTNNEPKESGKIAHPVEEYMPSHNLVKQTENQEISIDEIPGSDLKTLLERIQNAQKAKYTVGGTSGNASILFGNIKDVESNGTNIYILDNKKPSVIKVNASGDIIDVYGQKGRGPTDLFQPVDLEIADDGRIFVADSFNEIKVLRSTEEGIEHDESFLTPEVSALDMCVMNGNMYIRSISLNKTQEDSTAYNLVHVYSLDNFEYVRGFGEMYQSPRLEINRSLSGGSAYISCIESTDTVVYSFEYFPHIYGFSGKGELKWITKLHPYKDYTIEETVSEGNSVGMHYEIGGDLILNTKPFVDEYFHVKVLRSGTGVRSFVLSSNTGQGFNLGYSTLPDILNVDQNNFYIRGWDNNNVTIEVFER